MDATITWIDARRQNPPDGVLVLAAVTGRYPADQGEVSSAKQDFWLVMAMHFRAAHPVEGSELVVRDCYWDADGVIRKPYGAGAEEEVTHWAALPPLPGVPASILIGAPVASGLASAGMV